MWFNSTSKEFTAWIRGYLKWRAGPNTTIWRLQRPGHWSTDDRPPSPFCRHQKTLQFSSCLPCKCTITDVGHFHRHGEPAANVPTSGNASTEAATRPPFPRGPTSAFITERRKWESKAGDASKRLAEITRFCEAGKTSFSHREVS